HPDQAADSCQQPEVMDVDHVRPELRDRHLDSSRPDSKVCFDLLRREILKCNRLVRHPIGHAGNRKRNAVGWGATKQNLLEPLWLTMEEGRWRVGFISATEYPVLRPRSRSPVNDLLHDDAAASRADLLAQWHEDARWSCTRTDSRDWHRGDGARRSAGQLR